MRRSVVGQSGDQSTAQPSSITTVPQTSGNALSDNGRKASARSAGVNVS